MLGSGLRGLSYIVACAPVAVGARFLHRSSTLQCEGRNSAAARRAQHIFTDSHAFNALPNDVKQYVMTNYDATLESVGMRMYDHLAEKLQDGSLDALEVVFSCYLPVYAWVKYMREQHKPGTPLVVGLSAPQGCGKTTLVEHLQAALAAADMQCATLSLDDLYLTAAEQRKLAQEHPSNPLLKYRGNAGTHDLVLATEWLTNLKNARPGQMLRVPRFDKSVNNGRGDRAPQLSWPQVQAPIDVILLEGWMLGFEAQPSSKEPELEQIHPGLKEVNTFLAEYDQIYKHIDAWIIMQVNDPRAVYKWRLQAEQRSSRVSGKQGMTDDEVKDFVDRFMPAYKAYLPKLYIEGPPCHPNVAVPIPVLKLRVSDDRSISNAVCFSVCESS